MIQQHFEDKEKATLRERTLQFKLKEAERQIRETSQSSGHVPDSNQSYGHEPYSTIPPQLPKPRPNAQYVTPRESSKEIPRSNLRVQVAAGAPHDSPPDGGGGATAYHHIGTTPDVSSVDSSMTSPVPDEPLCQGTDYLGRPLYAGTQLPVGTTDKDWFEDECLNSKKIQISLYYRNLRRKIFLQSEDGQQRQATQRRRHQYG